MLIAASYKLIWRKKIYTELHLNILIRKKLI